MRNSPTEIDAAEKYPHEKKQRERKQVNTIFNEVRQLAYILGTRERDFIDSTINTREYQRDTSRDTIHEGSKPYL